MQLDDSRSVMICKSNVRLHFTYSQLCGHTRKLSIRYCGAVVAYRYTPKQVQDMHISLSYHIQLYDEVYLHYRAHVLVQRSGAEARRTRRKRAMGVRIQAQYR